MIYNLKDIIAMNQDLNESGHLMNRSGLEFALDRVNKEKSWLRQAAMLVRAIVTDHAFEDGNKRTAYVLFADIVIAEGKYYDKNVLAKAIHSIARKNISNIGTIERLLKNATKQDKKDN